MCLATKVYVHVQLCIHVTIFSTHDKFRPVSNFTELHTLTPATHSYICSLGLYYHLHAFYWYVGSFGSYYQLVLITTNIICYHHTHVAHSLIEIIEPY